eukprot:GEMP01025468.1.p1 GENE.GEMP01025468.1~~GEMP01025468.1.p1  ORF type:complete len:399 (+),score=91.58 GEMP01025468.1:87-1283(+)
MLRNSDPRRAHETPQKVLLRCSGNGQCAECRTMGPTWASVNLGVFVCIQCAGIHRRLGVHITFVQSVTSDFWKPEWVERLRLIGNDVAAHFYEYHPSAQAERFTPTPYTLTGGDRMQEDVAKRLENWIRAKYERQSFARPEFQPPHVLVARGEDPRAIYGLPPLAWAHAPTESRMLGTAFVQLDVERKQHKAKKDKRATLDFADVFAQMATGAATLTPSPLASSKVEPFSLRSLSSSPSSRWEKEYPCIRAPPSPGRARIGLRLRTARETMDDHCVLPASRSTSSPAKIIYGLECAEADPTAGSSVHKRRGSKHAEHHKKENRNMSDVDFGDFDGVFVAMDKAGVLPPPATRFAPQRPSSPVRPLSPLSPMSPERKQCSIKEPLLPKHRFCHRRCFTR